MYMYMYMYVYVLKSLKACAADPGRLTQALFTNSAI